MKEGVKVNVETKPERCKQCSLCVSVCPTQAISFSNELNAKGYKFTIIDHEKCIACGMCYITCPDGVYTILGDK